MLLTEVDHTGGPFAGAEGGDTVFEASHDPLSTAPTDGLGSGSLVSVTGIYAFESGPPPAFRVLLRSGGDVVLLAAPPWWTRGIRSCSACSWP